MSVLNVVGKVLEGVPIVGGIIAGFSAATPKLEDEVTVEVLGQPGAKKRELYKLALATAYGLVRRFDGFQFLGPPPGMLMIEYDAADNWVRCTLRYKTSILTANLGSAPSITKESVVAQGPDDFVIGANSKPFMTVKPVPLPFDKKTILSILPNTIDPNPSSLGGGIIPSPNPRPSGDNRSRGSVLDPAITSTDYSNAAFLVPLVFAALSNPGSQNSLQYPPPAPGPQGF